MDESAMRKFQEDVTTYIHGTAVVLDMFATQKDRRFSMQELEQIIKDRTLPIPNRLNRNNIELILMTLLGKGFLCQDLTANGILFWRFHTS